MKDPERIKDPLLAAIIDETSGITKVASAQVRARYRARRIVARATCSMLLVLGIVAFWLTKLHRHSTNAVHAVPAILATTPQGYLRVHWPGETPTSDPLPAGVSNQEKQLLNELRDVPVLIVNNTRGEVTRVHVFER